MAAVLKAAGLGESWIGEPIADSMETGRNPAVGGGAGRLIAPVEAEIRVLPPAWFPGAPVRG